jgi:intracellular sulfur oxidation DsrE/DsrF family protein
MKSILCLAALAVTTIGAVAVAPSQQPEPYKVVFDLTSPDPVNQQAVLRWIKEISTANPGAEMEVVMYGHGLDLVVAGKSSLQSAVEDATRTAHASFKVCAIAMRNQKIERSQLLPKVEVVPDGIGELVARQRAGWGYIKVAH